MASITSSSFRSRHLSASHTDVLAVRKVAPDLLQLVLNFSRFVTLWWRFRFLFLLLLIFACQLVSILEYPDALSIGLVVLKRARVESTVRKNPLSTYDPAFFPLTNEFSAILGITVSSAAVLLVSLPLSDIDVAIRIGERPVRLIVHLFTFATSPSAGSVVPEECASSEWLRLVTSIFFLISILRTVRHLAKAMLFVLFVVPLVTVPVLFVHVDALPSAVALDEGTIVSVFVWV
mmetsp:Transcript_124744/g.233309  ORF Transcript_124744/g.233309 Transcript_124744/m.233309 type:complete len:234 (+) Transcript_124744:231-932(+)